MGYTGPHSEIVEFDIDEGDYASCVDAYGVQICVGDIVASFDWKTCDDVFVVEEISYLVYSNEDENEMFGEPGFAVSGGGVYECTANQCVRLKSCRYKK